MNWLIIAINHEHGFTISHNWTADKLDKSEILIKMEEEIGEPADEIFVIQNTAIVFRWSPENGWRA